MDYCFSIFFVSCQELHLKRLNQISSSLFTIILVLLLIKQLPRFYSNFQVEGKNLTAKEFINLKTSEKLVLPNRENSVVLFWASWCAPCKLEMERLQLSVNSGKIPPNSIYALNLFENQEQIIAFIENNRYPFQFINPVDSSFEIKVDGTPTLLLLEGMKVLSFSTGVSLIGIWRAEWMF